MSNSIFQTQYFQVDSQRRLAFSHVGQTQCSRVLLCLPGLLETRATFDPLLSHAQSIGDLRVIALDHCGRGDSDGLVGDVGYTMSRYLHDISHFARQYLLSQGVQDIYVLGTSMGGILGMYLAQQLPLAVKGILLNDVGLSLNWMSIYSLYGGMKKSSVLKDKSSLAKQLRVREAVVDAVMMPTHFDLPYRKNLRGMHFDAVVKDFHGEVRLVYGQESSICLLAQVSEIKHHFAHAKVMSVAHAAHPVPFTPDVCDFYLHDWLAQTREEKPWAPPSSAQQQNSDSIDTASEPASTWLHRMRSGLKRWWR
jgi:pimeloyl-ACP methyl ester carboxylesterase